jgi:uncharacterized protein (TIGR03067 family)
MRRAAIVVVVIVCLAAGRGVSAATEDAAVENEVKKLAGTWIGVSGEETGKKAPEKEIKQLKLVFAGDKFTATAGGKLVMKGSVRVDPARKPKTIDLVSDGPRQKGKISPGIYELDGDTLRLCLVDTGAERPKEFSTDGAEGRHLLVYKRER